MQSPNSIDKIPNSLPDFQIVFIEGHLYNDDFLSSDLYFFFYTFYSNIIILIDSATVAITIFQVRTKANEFSLSIFSS